MHSHFCFNSKIFLITLTIFLVASCDNNSERTYGGAKVQNGNHVLPTSDGGAIIVGNTANRSAGFFDVYTLKLDSRGEVAWSRTHGGSGWDYGQVVRQTADGGFIVAGTTQSYGPGDPNNHGSYGNFWIFKLNADGQILWEKVHGNFEVDNLNAMILTREGGFLLAGTTNSTASTPANSSSFYIVKVNSDGDKEWDQTYGEVDVPDIAYAMAQHEDGGYVIAGTSGFTADTAESLIIKIDQHGNQQWKSLLGEENKFDQLADLRATADGGFIAAGKKFDYWHPFSSVASRGLDV